MTLLLGRGDLTELLAVDECLAAIRVGFAAARSSIEPQRVRTDLPGQAGTATALIPGLVDGIPAYTVKVNAKFPAASPALRGIVCLHDLSTGELLAVLDSATITAWRTGLAAALGTHLIARAGARSVGVIGAGAQAELVLKGLAALRPIDDLVVHDLVPERATAFGGDPVATSAEVARRSEIVVLATWSRSPLLAAADLRPGMHLTSLGADEPGKVELAADLLRSATVLVDDVRLATAVGAISHADATLAEVVQGKAPGRTRDDEITVYAPVGLPWQDLALSWLAYQSATRQGSGSTYDWLA
ncbi:ornithine cyclodeaminase family protein [Flindersiella endophytica]